MARYKSLIPKDFDGHYTEEYVNRKTKTGFKLYSQLCAK